MPEDNVFQMPTSLERLAKKLTDLQTRDASNRQEWIEIQVSKCLTLVEIRDQFPGDTEFGRWCTSNGFDNIDPHDRAAAIEMGRKSEALRKCLEATTRTSLRLIYREEFDRFVSADKAPPKDKPKRQRKPKSDKPPPSPEIEEPIRDMVDEVHRRLNAGETFTQADIGKKFGRGKTAGHDAILVAQVERRLAKEPAPIDTNDMQHSMRERYEATVKRREKQLRNELMAEVRAEVHEIYAGYLKEHNEKIVRADRIINSHKGYISRDAFRKIKASLHPDHNKFTHATEALRAFSELEDILVKAESQPPGPPLPKTVADLLKQRRAR